MGRDASPGPESVNGACRESNLLDAAPSLQLLDQGAGRNHDTRNRRHYGAASRRGTGIPDSRASPRIMPAYRLNRVAVRQRGRSMAGFLSKKAAGIKLNPWSSNGSMGQSSGRATWWKPMVYQSTISVFSMRRFSEVQ